MLEKKDYSNFTLEELQQEEKKLKSHEKLSAGLIGLMIGVLIYGIVVTGPSFVRLAFPGILIVIFAKAAKSNKENLKLTQEEIQARSTR